MDDDIYAHSELRAHWQKWMPRIPQLSFPPDWRVRIWPPFGGALIRFQVDDKISVYLNVNNALGYMNEPYWEIYPYEGDTFRCPMNETDELIAAINRAREHDNG